MSWSCAVWTRLAALSGLVSVAAGAFAAHGIVDPAARDWVRTGAHFEAIHALAILACAALFTDGVPRAGWPPALFLSGSVLFSGSLYAMALGAPRWMGAVTPLGGLSLMAGWAALIWIGGVPSRPRARRRPALSPAAIAVTVSPLPGSPPTGDLMSALASQMPKVAFADVGDIRLAYYEVGPRVGVPVIFCHGFPELAFSWRHQLRAFEAAGRWAIAPDQRGYGLTSRPGSVEAYDIEALTGDIIGLMDHLGVERAVLCGHDWGGIVVWQTPLRHAGRVAGVIGLNTPFMPRSRADPIAIMRKRFGEDMYIVNFQKRGEADAVLAADVAKTMSFFMRRPPPGTPPASGGLSGDGVAAPTSTFALLKMLEAWDPRFDPRETFLSTRELTAFVETFESTGFTGGINWYRNFTRNWERSAGIVDRVEAPSLMVMAELDAVLPPSAADGMEAWVPNLEKRLIKASGHWTQQEKPDEVNRIILDWMDRRFPK